MLFNIAGKKLSIMEHLLKLIKESSMDCNLNREETVDLDNAFTCMSMAQNLTEMNILISKHYG